MEQTVMQVGNSLAVTLPKVFVNGKKIKAGQKVIVDADIESGVIEVRTANTPKSSLTPEFKLWLDEVSAKHGALIKELAKR